MTTCNVCEGRGFPGQEIEFVPNPSGGWVKYAAGTNKQVLHYCKGSTNNIPTTGPNLIPQGQPYQPQGQQPQTNGTPDEFKACTTCGQPQAWRPTGEYWPQGHPKAGRPKYLPWNPDGTRHTHPKGSYGAGQGQFQTPQQPQITQEQIQFMIAQTVNSAAIAFASALTSINAKQDEIMAFIRGQIRQNADAHGDSTGIPEDQQIAQNNTTTITEDDDAI